MDSDDNSSAVREQPIRGAWTVEFAKGVGLLLTLSRSPADGDHPSSSFNLPLTRNPGIRREDLLSQGEQVHFVLTRDAGNLTFDGHVGQGLGDGSFSFDASSAFVECMRSLGYERLSGEELFAMAVHNVSVDYVKEFIALGYEHVPLDQLLSMHINGVSVEFVQKLQSLGYEQLPAQELIAMRIHDVTPELIYQLREFGYDRISADQLVAMRVHDVTPGFIREFWALGYKTLPVAQLVALRIHGVQANFARRLQEMGYDRVSVDQLISMQINGMRTALIARALKDKDYFHSLTREEQQAVQDIGGIGPSDVTDQSLMSASSTLEGGSHILITTTDDSSCRMIDKIGIRICTC
jgi:hypothetical protein